MLKNSFDKKYMEHYKEYLEDKIREMQNNYEDPAEIEVVQDRLFEVERCLAK